VYSEIVCGKFEKTMEMENIEANVAFCPNMEK
jgi:hypothetical protein